MSHYNILVLEGGGAKGPYEMGVLERLEEKAQQRIPHFIDLVVSTSVGSVLGSLICTDTRPAAEWSKIILDELPSFFTKRGCMSIPLYDKQNYAKCFEKYVRSPYYMAELPLMFMVTSVDRCQPRTHYFKSWEEKDGQIPVVEATMRSFSAPYFFGATIDEVGSKVWLDGGMGADNLPLTEAYIETLLQGWLGVGNTANILAIGSGRKDEYVPFDQAKKSNIFSQTLDQFKSFVNITEGGLARTLSSLEQVRSMIAITKATPNLSFQFIDWPNIPDNLDKMDDVDDRMIYYKKGLEDGENIDIIPFKVC
ncbi:MAG: patatin-like phospholipase family protein [Nitrospirae bacterium]|nr:patatin-like phospholipase family protein [Nitrospirota bacterium]